MTAATTAVVEVSRHVAAPPGRVFDSWLDPGQAGRWLFRTPDGGLERCEIDARVGGRFRIDERRGEELAEHRGEYVELDRPRRLVFDFFTSEEEAPTRVTVAIEPEGGGLRVTLSHALAPEWAEFEDRARQGWTMILEGLAKALNGDSC